MKELILKSLQTAGQLAIRGVIIGAVLALGGVDIKLAIAIGVIAGGTFFVIEKILLQLEYISGLMKLQRDEKIKNMLLERNQDRSLINQVRSEPKKFQHNDPSTSNILNESRPNGGQQKPKKRYHKRKYSGPKPERK